MKNLIISLILVIAASMIGNAQISSNAPSTVSAFGGTYNIQFTIPSGQIWYNTVWSNNGGITFPFNGSQIVAGSTPAYTFTVDANKSCERTLKIVLQNIGTGATYTITITQLSTIPSLAIGRTITGTSSVCPGSSNVYRITTTPGSYTTWITTGASSAIVNGTTVVPITYQWYSKGIASSTNSGASMTATFTSPGTIIVRRDNGCDAKILGNRVYDTLNVTKIVGEKDSVTITPSVINTPYGLPITFTACGTNSILGTYSWRIINGTSTTVVATSTKTYTYTNYNQNDIVMCRMSVQGCTPTIYKFSNQVAIPSSPITSIETELTNTEYNVYPNPFVETFNTNNLVVESIYDITGKIIPYTQSDNTFTTQYKGLLLLKTDKGIIKLISE